MSGGRKKKYSLEFRAQAVERMKTCANVSALARELGIRRKWLYEWRDNAAEVTAEIREARKEERQSERLRRQVAELQRTVGQQAVKLDFFEGALRRIKEVRHNSGNSGGTASTTRSGA